MQFLFHSSRRLEGLTNLVGKAAVWLLLALMLVIVSDVVLRRWFVIGSTKLQELEWHLHGALFLLCLGWAYTRGAHVRIELLTERLSARTAAWIEMLGCLLLLLPYVTAILIFGWDYTAYSIQYNEASASATGLPYRWIIKSMIVIGFALLGAAGLSRLFDCIVFLFGEKSLAERTAFAHARAQKGAS